MTPVSTSPVPAVASAAARLGTGAPRRPDRPPPSPVPSAARRHRSGRQDHGGLDASRSGRRRRPGQPRELAVVGGEHHCGLGGTGCQHRRRLAGRPRALSPSASTTVGSDAEETTVRTSSAADADLPEAGPDGQRPAAAHTPSRAAAGPSDGREGDGHHLARRQCAERGPGGSEPAVPGPGPQRGPRGEPGGTGHAGRPGDHATPAATCARSADRRGRRPSTSAGSTTCIRADATSRPMSATTTSPARVDHHRARATGLQRRERHRASARTLVSPPARPRPTESTASTAPSGAGGTSPGTRCRRRRRRPGRRPGAPRGAAAASTTVDPHPARPEHLGRDPPVGAVVALAGHDHDPPAVRAAEQLEHRARRPPPRPVRSAPRPARARPRRSPASPPA